MGRRRGGTWRAGGRAGVEAEARGEEETAAAEGPVSED